MRTLRQCLLDTYLVRLRAIARFWDVDLQNTRQRDVAIELSEALSNPEAVERAWRDLPDEQREALAALLADDGLMPRRVFARQWGEIRVMGPGRMEREKPWRELISPAEGLWYRGFIFRGFAQGPEGAYEVVFVPPGLLKHLPKPDASPPQVTLEPTPAPANVHAAGAALLDDACTLLASVQNEHPQLTVEDDWPRRHADRLLQRLHDDDPERFAFLHHLARRLGWLRVDESRQLSLDPEPVTTWLQQPAHQQRRALFRAWRDDPTWNDLFHVPSLRPENPDAWQNAPLPTRKAFLEHLAAAHQALDAPPGSWHRLDDLVAAVKTVDPDFQRPDGDYTTWYIQDAETGAYLSGFESWEAVEGQLIRYLVTRPLAWLGLVEVGYDDEEEPAAFRLTAGGAIALELIEPPDVPEPAPLTLRPGFLLHVPPNRRYERFQLARVSRWERTGDPFVYRLTPSSLRRARQQGISAGRVLEFLAEVTGQPVPRYVEAAVTRWEARGAEARLERAVVLRLTDEDLMTEVSSSPRTGRFIRQRVGPKAALVQANEWPRLVAALGQMGLLSDVIAQEEEE